MKSSSALVLITAQLTRNDPVDVSSGMELLDNFTQIINSDEWRCSSQHFAQCKIPTHNHLLLKH